MNRNPFEKELKTLETHLSNHWQDLESYLSKPLDDVCKQKTLNCLWFLTISIKYAKNAHKDDTLLYHEIDVFKKTIQVFIPKFFDEESFFDEQTLHLKSNISTETEANLKRLWKALSVRARQVISDQIICMTRSFTMGKVYHPRQYDIAAKLALDSLPKPQKHQGRGKSIGKKGIYKIILELWRELGETNLSVTYNPNQDINHESPLVGFTHNFLKIANTFANSHAPALNTIRQDLAKYKKLIYLQV